MESVDQKTADRFREAVGPLAERVEPLKFQVCFLLYSDIAPMRCDGHFCRSRSQTVSGIKPGKT